MPPHWPMRGRGAILEPKRAVDSFARPSAARRCAEELEQLLHDYDDFVTRMMWYRQLGIPFRRGYLLHGRAGSGKTTFAKLLASRNGGGLYIIDLSDSRPLGLDDNNFSDMIRLVAPRSVLLLKNIDSFVKERGNVKKKTFKAKKQGHSKPAAAVGGDVGAAAAAGDSSSATPRDAAPKEGGAPPPPPPPPPSPSKYFVNLDASPGASSPDAPPPKKGGIGDSDDESDSSSDDEDEAADSRVLGYSAVLNALDGALANNQGLAIIMTTNNLAKLSSPEFANTSEALLRPGRVDLRVRIEKAVIDLPRKRTHAIPMDRSRMPMRQLPVRILSGYRLVRLSPILTRPLFTCAPKWIAARRPNSRTRTRCSCGSSSPGSSRPAPVRTAPNRRVVPPGGRRRAAAAARASA